jgi:hypothetical protein
MITSSAGGGNGNGGGATTSGGSNSSGGSGSPRAPSPQRQQSVFNQLAAQMGVLGPLTSPSDIHGLHKASVARGEDDFPSARLRVRLGMVWCMGCLSACAAAGW